MNKLIVILGPTSSGKSLLAIKLAKKFKGEIISADSRQVYKGMDIGTGKVSKAEQKLVKHHLLDVASPNKQFTVAQYKLLTNLTIVNIISREKIPFLVGGTPFYIYSVIDDLQIPEVAPNLKLRSMLRSKSTTKLFRMLEKLDPRRAKNIDAKNPRRLIRAIEIVRSTGKPVPAFTISTNGRDPSAKGFLVPSDGTRNGVLLLGLKKSQNELYELIDRRLEQRLKAGMIAEVKKLLKAGVTHKRLQEMGLEYRFISLHLQGHLTYDQMVTQLKSAIHKFSKRQMTWFKRDKRIKWITNQKQAEKLVKNYLLTHLERSERSLG